MTGINLDALDGLDAFDDLGQVGKPLMVPIDRVHEDPHQPRKSFDDVKQIELAASVAEGGVRVPVSVRPHPNIPGHFMLNFGARRRRAVLSAGLTEIPAWIDERFDDFDQVIENVQRAELTPMEMTLFIKDKLASGLKASEIAQRLGMSRSAIVKFSALIDPPAEIEAVYTSGRSTSPDTLYELRMLYKLFPEQTRAWLAEDHDVSRRSVDDLRRSLAGQESAPDAPGELKPRKARATDPNLVRRPMLAIKVEDRMATLVLNRRASRDGQVLIRWDDTAEVQEVAADAIRVVRLDDARRYEPLGCPVDVAK